MELSALAFTNPTIPDNARCYPVLLQRPGQHVSRFVLMEAQATSCLYSMCLALSNLSSVSRNNQGLSRLLNRHSSSSR